MTDVLSRREAVRRLEGEIKNVLAIGTGVFSCGADQLANSAISLPQLTTLDSRMLARALILDALAGTKIDIKTVISNPDDYFQDIQLLTPPERLGRAKK